MRDVLQTLQLPGHDEYQYVFISVAIVNDEFKEDIFSLVELN